VTVAIAAVCEFHLRPMIVAAEDRMVTAGDIEFEQPQPKGWQFGRQCVGLLYGMMAAQGEIASKTWNFVAANGLSSVETIAERYGFHQREYIAKRAEHAILAPLGLTRETFLARASSMSRELVSDTHTRLQNYYWDSGLCEDLGGAIIAGTEPLGASVITVEHGQLDDMTGIGFVGRGTGGRHAESEFMFGGFTRKWMFPETLALLHRAKKRAEVAPGVGSQTDLVVITHLDPFIFHYHHETPMLHKLEAAYQRAERARSNAIQRETKTIKAMFPPTEVPTELPEEPSVEGQSVPPQTTHDPKPEPPSQG
jgi:hypothetical protein